MLSCFKINLQIQFVPAYFGRPRVEISGVAFGLGIGT